MRFAQYGFAAVGRWMKDQDMSVTITNANVATQLARQAGRAIESWRQLTDTHADADDAVDRLTALEAEVTFHPIGGGEAALFQMGVLSSLIVFIEDESKARAADRLIENLTSYLEKTSGVDRGTLGGYYFRQAPSSDNVHVLV